MGFEADGPSSSHPESCYMKLLVQKMLTVHNGKFITPARAALDPEGNREGATPLKLEMVRAVDMINFTMYDFEAAVREHATQSLKYGQGAHISYDYNGIEQWVFENVVANVPEIDTVGREFPFCWRKGPS